MREKARTTKKVFIKRWLTGLMSWTHILIGGYRLPIEFKLFAQVIPGHEQPLTGKVILLSSRLWPLKPRHLVAVKVSSASTQIPRGWYKLASWCWHYYLWLSDLHSRGRWALHRIESDEHEAACTDLRILAIAPLPPTHNSGWSYI